VSKSHKSGIMSRARRVSRQVETIADGRFNRASLSPVFKDQQGSGKISSGLDINAPDNEHSVSNLCSKIIERLRPLLHNFCFLPL